MFDSFAMPFETGERGCQLPRVEPDPFFRLDVDGDLDYAKAASLLGKGAHSYKGVGHCSMCTDFLVVLGSKNSCLLKLGWWRADHQLFHL